MENMNNRIVVLKVYKKKVIYFLLHKLQITLENSYYIIMNFQHVK